MGSKNMVVITVAFRNFVHLKIRSVQLLRRKASWGIQKVLNAHLLKKKKTSANGLSTNSIHDEPKSLNNCKNKHPRAGNQQQNCLYDLLQIVYHLVTKEIFLILGTKICLISLNVMMILSLLTNMKTTPAFQTLKFDFYFVKPILRRKEK